MDGGGRRKAEATSVKFAPRVAEAIARRDLNEMQSLYLQIRRGPLAEKLLDAMRRIRMTQPRTGE